MRKLPFDKYDLYRRAVQSPEDDVRFLREIYRKLKHREPKTLREDFCGTAAMSTEWVKLNKSHKAFGVDLDPEPVAYGEKHYLSALQPEQRQRIHLALKNVLHRGLPKADISVGLNFSYFLFKSRPLLREYFKNVHRSLNPKGIAVFDVFGGTQCTDSIEDRTRHKGFTYFWDQKDFDPITNYANFGIHFKVGKRKHKNVFTYDWRMWSIPELKEILHEAGFPKAEVYWEGTSRDGGGSGNFRKVTKGESCLAWIAYIIAEK